MVGERDMGTAFKPRLPLFVPRESSHAAQEGRGDAPRRDRGEVRQWGWREGGRGRPWEGPEMKTLGRGQSRRWAGAESRVTGDKVRKRWRL